MEFYGELLGWEFDGPGPGEYYVAKVRGRDVAGVGQAPPGVSPGWNTYVSVASAEHGSGPLAGSSSSRSTRCRPGASRCSRIPAARSSACGSRRAPGRQLVNEASAYAMSALHTGEPERLPGFYRDVFGWETEQFAPGIGLFRLPGYVGGEPAQPVPRDVVAVMAKDDGRVAGASASGWPTPTRPRGRRSSAAA